MATLWTDVRDKIVEKLKSAIPYAEIAVVHSISDYIDGNSAQSLVNDYTILVGPPAEGSVSRQPMLSWYAKKLYLFEIAVVVKTHPATLVRMKGSGKPGFYQIQADVEAALEHSNLGGLVDNKPGSNFEATWAQRPTEDKAISVYITTYSAEKTER